MSVSVRSFPSVGWVRRPHEDEPGSRLSGDPLGLRVFVQHLAGRISPGLGRGQANVWGFGLLCAGVTLAGDGIRAEERFVRWQRLALFAALHASSERPTWTVGGIRNAQRSGPSFSAVSLDLPLKADEHSGGLWGGYARAARMYGLMASAGTARLRDHRLTDRGQDLARVMLQELDADHARLQEILDGGAPVDISQLGLRVGTAPPPYLSRLGSLLQEGDRTWGSRLRWVWSQLDELAAPDPTQLPDDEPYDEDQGAAVRAAREVYELLEVVETAFRSRNPDALTGDLAEHAAFAQARSAGYGIEYDPVQAALEPGGTAALDQLWKIHRDRHRAGGAWERDGELTSYDATRPDFGLDAPYALFQQGLRL